MLEHTGQRFARRVLIVDDEMGQANTAGGCSVRALAEELQTRGIKVIPASSSEGGLATVVAAGLFVTVTNAEAATVFSADFESGSTSGWSKSGGTWSIVSDGSQVFQQSDSGSERAREFAGDTSWTNYSVQARVKATSFASTAGVVALTAGDGADSLPAASTADTL